ncbi:uncharacterized mitochondrial protein AtMg01250-like [Lycium barbarum]|uniref:uncharacterized mitochondrial protein AtMg01250-like n=1 Tax=Lycium barbarum TaxID=112863 RepID=UPI00293F12D3|nr:uncharacterized mitochondrial protein AtMg01250-like [Lycium barbarum]
MGILETGARSFMFPYQFVQWIMEYIYTVNYSIMINGEPSEPWDAARGLRQGDPISPYLCAISIEYLSPCLGELMDCKKFKFHPKCARNGVTHLCFADDLLLFTRGDLDSVSAIFDKFQSFSQASGLQANRGKSNMYFGGVT